MKIYATIKINNELPIRFSHISLRQAIGEHHIAQITIELNQSSADLAQRAKDWVGEVLDICIGKGSDEVADTIIDPLKSFKGLVTSVAMQRYYGTNQLIIIGKSPTIILDAGPHMRSFEGKTLEEIVTDVVFDANFSQPAIIEPKSSHKNQDEGTLPYIVQYKESDWNFLGRLAARYGKWLYYDGGNLYFKDEPKDKPAQNLNYASDSTNLNWTLKAVPKGFKFTAYNYLTNQTIEKEAKYGSEPGMTSLAKELIDRSASHIFTQKPKLFINQTVEDEELQLMVNRREQAHINDIIRLTGSTRIAVLGLGDIITVDDKDWFGEGYGQYRLLSVTHELTYGGNYMNHFEAIPKKVRVPNLTHSTDPPFCEDQVAEVIKVDDDKKLGRVKVKFRWQEKADDKTLPWIRVASPYTGANKGIYFLPEVGDQVLVSFEQQHPEKPFVLSGFYHHEAKPEHHHPQNDLKGIKTRGQNSILFNDKAKSESIEIRSPKNIGIHAGEKVQITAGKSIHISTAKNGQIIINAGDGGEVIIVGKKIVIKGQQNEHIVLQNNSAVINGGETAAMVANKAGIKGTNEVAINGAKVGIIGSSGVNIAGATVKLNS